VSESRCSVQEADDSNWRHQHVLYWCPGCQERHSIRVAGDGVPPPSWTWNGDTAKPTFAPSVHYVGYCHHFVRDGRIEFCSDSRPGLAGHTVELPAVDHDGYPREAPGGAT